MLRYISAALVLGVSLAFWQGGTDESWAIENLQVLVNVTQVNGAPEPMTLSLLAIALAGLGFSRRKRSS